MLITVVTPLFPISEEVYRGNPIYKTVVSLQRHADVKVLCPVAVYPPKIQPQYRYRRIREGFQPPNVNVEYLEYRVFPLLSRPFNGRICGSRLHERLKNIPFDVLLAYWVYPDGYASVNVGRRLRRPVVVGSRGSDLRRIQDPITRGFVKSAVTGADRVLTVSEDLRQNAIAIGAEPEKVRTIHNGADHAIFRYQSREEARRKLQVAQDARVILFVGWISRLKGVSVLCSAFAKLAAEDPRVQLILIGEGKSAQIEATLPDRVRLLGARVPVDVADWMAAADVLCLPSFSEGCPNVVLEATAAGCPVVASSVGGIPEIVSPDTGILTADQEPETLARALREALDRRWDRRRIAGVSVRTWDDVAADTFEVCRETVPSRRTAQVASPAIVRARRKPRIAVVTPYFPISEEPYRGHSAFHTLRFMKKDADIEVICPISIYPRVKWLNPSGYRYHRADLSYSPPELKTVYYEYPALPVVSRPLNGFTCAHFLEPHLKAAKPDIILNYWVYPEGFAAVRLGRRWGIPVVVGSIGSDILRTGDPLSLEFVRHTLKHATGVITVSENLRRNTIALGVPPERVTTVLNGCDRSVFHLRDRGAMRRELSIPQDAEFLLYVGWLSPTKGLNELVDSAAALISRHPRLRLALIGEGAHQPALEARIVAAGLKDRVLFLGRRSSEEVSQWMGASDVFVLPSHSEGCPNVIIEAIASGRPVVATDVGGIPELVNAECGLLIPAQNTPALTEALETALLRKWDHRRIAEIFSRGWETSAAETFDACCRAAGIPND